MNSSIFFNKAFRRAALASAVALGAFGASNSFAADATANSTADVITPITITSSGVLDFGRFATTDAIGTVIITTGGARSKTGGVILTTVDTTSSAATFVVAGDSNAAYSIGLTNTALSDGGTTTPNTMDFATITDFNGTDGETTEINVSSGALSSGAQTIHLGGILSVAANQAAGDYTGTVTATVEYN